MTLGLVESLPALVRAKYHAAQAASALTFASSELAIVRICGSPFQLRFCPSLAKKPQPNKGASASPKKRIDPFDNPDPELHILDVPQIKPSHLLVLNKFPIIPSHFILATKANKPQTHFLEQDDLWLTYSLLHEWNSRRSQNDDKLFAFFNSGDHSGASQPHRHVQLLPVQDMRHGDHAHAWDLLADSLGRASGSGSGAQVFPIGADLLPFRAFAARLGADLNATRLQQIYHALYNASRTAVESYRHSNPQGLQLHSNDDGELPISYNMAMTDDTLVMAPRRSEGSMLTRDDGSDVDFVSLNGTVLGGTLMVKNEEAWHLLQDNSGKLAEILASIGIPHSSEDHGNSQNL